MYEATCDTNRIVVTNPDNEIMTSGSVKVNFIEFSFSKEWDGLIKTAIFQTKKVSLPVILDEENLTIPIPWEVLVSAGETVNVGVYGVRQDNVGTPEDEEIVLPTVWGTIGKVQQGVLPSNPVSGAPTFDSYSELLKTIQDLIENGIGTDDHSILKNRNLPGQHPMSAINGLVEYLSSISYDMILEAPKPIERTYLEELLV